MLTTLTAAEARAIKGADTICFDHKTVDNVGRGSLRAIYRETETRSEVTHTFDVASSRVEDYGPSTGDNVTGFAMVMSAAYDEVWQTVARHIKAGSALGYRWTRDNNSPVTREAGLVVDHLDVKVQNTVRGKLVCDTFRVATYIGRDNSARMVKRH